MRPGVRETGGGQREREIERRKLTFEFPASSVSMVMVKIECDREESLFIAVAPTDLFFLPTFRSRVGG